MAVHGHLGSSEPAAVDDRRVVELVAAHEHTRARECGDDTEVGRGHASAVATETAGATEAQRQRSIFADVAGNGESAITAAAADALRDDAV